MHNIHAFVLPYNERNIPVCCKFTGLHSHQILLKSVNISLSYCEKQKGELFLKHSVYSHAVVIVVGATVALSPWRRKMIDSRSASREATYS